VSGQAVLHEFRLALLDGQATAREYGNPVRVRLRGAESDVSRDPYRSIKARPTATVFDLNSPQMDFSPTVRRLEKAGLRQDCDLVVWLCVQDMMDRGISFDDFEVNRTTIDALALPGEDGGTSYQVREKAKACQFAVGYLYWTFGLTRRG
jgi:hypothetical protein